MPVKKAPVKVKKEDPIVVESNPQPKSSLTWCDWAEQQPDPKLALQQMGQVFSEYSKYLETFFGSKVHIVPRPD